MSKAEILEPRKIPSQKRSRETVAAIYEAAIHIFTEIGFAESTTEHIAERAGVSIGTLYNYFLNKEAILHGLWEKYEQDIRLVTQTADKLIRDQGYFDRRILPILMNIALDLVSHDKLQNRLFISQIGLPEVIIQKRRALGIYMESVMEAILRDFSNVRIKNPKIGVHIVWTTVQAVFHDYILSVSDEIKPEEFMAELGDMMGRYIFVDDEPS